MSTTHRKLRVFLCHASQDKPIIRELYQRLLAEGWIDPWLDEEKLLPGQDWDMEIEKAVEAADTVIVCLSNNSTTKEGYIQKEIKKVLDVADEKPEGTIFVVPLKLELCEVPNRLRHLQWVDFFQVNGYERLMVALRHRAIALGTTRVNILIVEEDVMSAHGFSKQLETQAQAVFTTHDLYHAIDLAKQQTFNTVIINALFAHRSIFDEFTNSLYAKSPNAHILVVCLISNLT